MNVFVKHRSALCAFLMLFLAGCNFTLPQVESATVGRYDAGRRLQVSELAASQVQALTDWFSRHGAGWSSSVISYVPIVEIRAKHADGDLTVINITSNLVIVYRRGGQYEHQFTSDEIAELLNIAGAEYQRSNEVDLSRIRMNLSHSTPHPPSPDSLR